MRLTPEQELELWKKWKQTKGQYELNQLIASFQPLINSQVDKYSRGSSIPKSVYMGEAMKLFIKALESYDPKRGASLGTHVFNGMKKLYRFHLTYQNAGRITSEGRAGNITRYHNAVAYLSEKLGREPTVNEIADEMGIPPSEVARIQKDLRKDLTLNETFDSTGMSPGSNPQWDRLMSIYHYEATPEEKLVIEYLYGIGGKPKIDSVQEIARRLNMTPNRVSQIKRRIHKKLTGY